MIRLLGAKDLRKIKAQRKNFQRATMDCRTWSRVNGGLHVPNQLSFHLFIDWNDSMSSNKPEAIVQAQLDAYNAHDVNALVAIYADDVEQYAHPATLLARGSAQLRARFETRFASARPQAELRQRIVSGNTVIDHETVRSATPEGDSATDLVAIYEVSGTRIAKAWFIFGSTTVTPAAV
jgi:hypothetical protein